MAEVTSEHLSASLEDYLEAIFNLSAESTAVRSRDIARLMEVSKASVTGALRVLKKKGLANYEPYDYVTLTEPGEASAAKVVHKHNILKAFFVDVLGIDPDIAQQAACRAEHTLGSPVISRLLAFIEFVTHNSDNGYDLVEQFRQFCENNLEHITSGELDK